MRNSKLLFKIKKCVRKKSVKKTFRVADFYFLIQSKSFLSKHCDGNPGNNTAFFVRISRGLYRLI